MLRFLYSVFYFFTLPFRRKVFDVVFYAPIYFNRGEDGNNPYFTHLIQACKNQDLSYIVFEEPAQSNHVRNKQSIPFDFIFFLIIFLRRWVKVENDPIQTQNNIGDFLSKSFFRGFKYAVDFSGIPLDLIPKYYFIDFEEMSLLDLAMELCDVLSHDLYVRLMPVIDHDACEWFYDRNEDLASAGRPEDMVVGIIRLEAIDRSEKPSYGAIKDHRP